jgi:hypothetical protein
MGKRPKVVPDHYRTDPGAKVPRELYEEQVEKLQSEEAPPVEAGLVKVGELLHAGQPLERPVAAVCVQCQEEVGFPGGTPVTACRSCGSDTFRVKAS